VWFASSPVPPVRTERENQARGRVGIFGVRALAAFLPLQRRQRTWMFSNVAGSACRDRCDVVCGQVVASATPCAEGVSSDGGSSKVPPAVVIATLFGGA
jgi:hypothetical protein